MCVLVQAYTCTFVFFMFMIHSGPYVEIVVSSWPMRDSRFSSLRTMQLQNIVHESDELCIERAAIRHVYCDGCVTRIS